MSFFENTRKPAGFSGRVMVSMMNLCHSPMARWGFRFLKLAGNAAVLDCGCGGGANLTRLLKKCPDGIVKGIDYSPVSVEKARKVNQQAIQQGRCTVLQGSVADMIFASSWFDAVTAFETVYFWPDLPACFREVYRAPEKYSKWTEIIDGMTVYRDTELQAALEQAGFHHVQTRSNKMGWLCVTARK